MKIEFVDINGMHVVSLLKEENSFFELSQDNYKIIERWKLGGNKKIYLKLLGDNIEYTSILGALIYSLINTLKKEGFSIDIENIPEQVREMLLLSLKKTGNPPYLNTDIIKTSFFEKVGIKSYNIYQDIKKAFDFINNSFSSVMNFIKGTAVYRKKDFWFIFEDCSYKAVGIVALVSFLVGLIVAFVGAIQLKSFGAGIYVASMVSIGMTRIMAAIMVGIVMAGRTGSSYAATLGTMQSNEEIDALKTLGVNIYEYLVAPRIISLVLVIPFLTLLADILGIFGGAVVGIGFLNISSSSYFDYAIKALSLSNTLIGVFHSFVYGIIIAICGCYEGINAGRNADSVGRATTNAVVTALVWMIVATGIITILLEVIGLW